MMIARAIAPRFHPVPLAETPRFAVKRAMAEDLMGYPELMEKALKGVVRAALDRVADDGLPGAHHLYITFRTGAPGVEIAPGSGPSIPTRWPSFCNTSSGDWRPTTRASG